MKFKRVEAYGFKSFADKAVLNFQDGITAIVGPNGCGKSNVVDAVRWVLGERSIKLLRGKSMQDVIFSGTERRKAMSYAEVNLVFNNEGPDRIFKTLEFDEVSISRKLYRNGNSEYYINGTQARLTDLLAIVRETGLGREGYSIVGQGKIQELVTAKPETRRTIFEDAAGVLPSKQARKEALNNLAAYEVNKQQLEALIDEMTRNSNNLEKKAEAAKRYLEIRDELMKLEANSYIFQKDNQAAQKARLQGLIDGLAEEIEKLNKDLDLKSEEFSKLLEDQAQVDEQLAAIQEEKTALAVKQESIAGQGNTFTARRDGYLNTKRDYSERLTKLEEHLDDINAKIREIFAKKQMSEEDKLEIQDDYNAAVQRQTDLTKDILDRELALENKNSEINKLLETVGDIKANIGTIEAQKQAVLDRIGEYNEEIGDIQSQVDNNEEIKSKLEESVNKLKEQKDKLDATVERLNNRYAELEKSIEEARETVQEMNAQNQTLSAQKAIYENMIRSHEGFAIPVQKLLKEADTNAYVKSKIIGLVAGLMQVPSKIQLAIETALGASIQNVVVENEYDAKELIEFQKRNSIGRITYSPLTSVKPRSIDPRYKGIVNEKGCLGDASKLIKYDLRFENVFSNLLGNTVICENQDVAIEIARKYDYGVRIVTLDGEVLSTTGTMSGGSATRGVGVLSQETRLKEINEELAKLRKEFVDIKRQFDEDKEEYDGLEEQIEEYENEASDVNEKYIGENSRFNAIVDILVGLNQRLDAAKQGKAKVEAQYKLYVDALNKVSSQNQAITGNKADIDKDAREGREAFNSKKKEKEQIDQKVQTLSVDLQTIKDKIEGYAADLERLENDKSVTKENINQCREVLKSNETNIQSVDSKLKNTVMSDEDKKRLREIDAVISQYQEKKKELVDKTKKVSDEKSALSEKIIDATNKKGKNEKTLVSIDEKMANIEEKMLEDYNLDYNGALVYKDDSFEFEPAQDRIRSLRASKNALGPVDVSSIDEYKVEKERLEAKQVEYDDLIKAEEDLRNIIDGLTKEILEKFNIEFEKIQANFQEVFKELFAGGSGRLSLREPEEGQDPLDAGVDIYAQPPGKKVQEMTLLSGGEQALTAMAVLFAILRLRPLPFVILDEVEAALDEGNVGVYAKYIKKFSKETQFIVITHRKPTMEKSDILFGVTMQEKGVSKVVQVSLEEAVKHSKKEAEKIEG